MIRLEDAQKQTDIEFFDDENQKHTNAESPPTAQASQQLASHSSTADIFRRASNDSGLTSQQFARANQQYAQTATTTRASQQYAQTATTTSQNKADLQNSTKEPNPTGLKITAKESDQKNKSETVEAQLGSTIKLSFRRSSR